MNNHSSLLFLVPLTIGGKGIESRLCGVRFLRCDNLGNPIGQEQTLRCKIPSHVLPSPAHLMRSRVDPKSLSTGLLENEFYFELEKILTSENLTLITWDLSYLESFESLALRSFLPPTLLNIPKKVIELKNLLSLCHYFSETKLPNFKNLTNNLKALKLKTDTAHENPLQDLITLYFYLLKLEPKMCAFVSRDNAQKLQTLDKAYYNQEVQVLINHLGELKLVLPINKITGDPNLKQNPYYEALSYQEGEIEKIVLNPLLNETLAPLSILTSKRLAKLNLTQNLLINIQDTLKAQESNALALPQESVSLPLGYSFFKKLSTLDLKYYQEFLIKNPRALTQAPLESSPYFRQFVFLFRATNFLGTFIDQELELYQKIIKARMQKALPAYLKEIELIAGNLDENDEKSQNYLSLLVHYIEMQSA